MSEQTPHGRSGPPPESWRPPAPPQQGYQVPLQPGYPAPPAAVYPGAAPGYPTAPGYPAAPGHPATAPGYPGAGYSAAPGYPATPGYPSIESGYPAAPGYPGQPGTPPPYPGQPPYTPGAYGQVPPPKNPRRGLLIGGIAAVVVLAVCVAAGGFIWQNVAGGGSTKLEVAWAKEAEEEKLPGEDSGDPVDWYALWLFEDLVIRPTTDGVVAYQLNDGSQAWTVPMPEGTRMCTAAPAAIRDRGVIAFGGTRCDQVGVIDLKAGKLAVTAQVPAPRNAGSQPATARLVAAGDVAVLDDEGALTAIGISDGRQRWRQDNDDCNDDVYAMDEKRIVLERRSCSQGQDTFLATVDSATGRELTQTPLGQRAIVLNVVSTDPVVAVIGPDARQQPDPVVVAIDDTGNTTAEVQTKGSGRDLEFLGSSSLNSSTGISQPAMAVRDNVLFAVNKAATPRSVVAFDLTSGKELWAEKGNEGDALILRVDDRGVWAVENGTSDGYLMLIDPTSGNTSVVGSGVMSPVWPSIESNYIYEHNGMLVATLTSHAIDVGYSLVVYN
jgi:outer membrane protein assembly factor BamB